MCGEVSQPVPRAFGGPGPVFPVGSGGEEPGVRGGNEAVQEMVLQGFAGVEFTTGQQPRRITAGPVDGTGELDHQGVVSTAVRRAHAGSSGWSRSRFSTYSHPVVPVAGGSVPRAAPAPGSR